MQWDRTLDFRNIQYGEDWCTTVVLHHIRNDQDYDKKFYAFRKFYVLYIFYVQKTEKLNAKKSHDQTWVFFFNLTG